MAASLLVAHPRILASGLRRVPGGSGDVCFAHDCIEHTWAWFLAPALVLAAIAVLADGELRPWVLEALRQVGRRSARERSSPPCSSSRSCALGGTQPTWWAFAAPARSSSPAGSRGSTRGRTAGGTAAWSVEAATAERVQRWALPWPVCWVPAER